MERKKGTGYMLEAQKNSGMGRENQISSDLNCPVFRFRFEFSNFFLLCAGIRLPPGTGAGDVVVHFFLLPPSYVNHRKTNC